MAERGDEVLGGVLLGADPGVDDVGVEGLEEAGGLVLAERARADAEGGAVEDLAAELGVDVEEDDEDALGVHAGAGAEGGEGAGGVLARVGSDTGGGAPARVEDDAGVVAEEHVEERVAVEDEPLRGVDDGVRGAD
jgi:hypothetical protein